MGSARKGCREKNTIVAKAAPNSRYINRRGRVQTASRPLYIGELEGGVVRMSYDEDIENNSESTKSRAVSGNSEWSWDGVGEILMTTVVKQITSNISRYTIKKLRVTTERTKSIFGW